MSDIEASSWTEPEWAALVAIDWSDQKHCWELVDPATGQHSHGEISGTPEAVQEWAAGLYQRFGGRPIAVCLEQSRGPLIYQLSPYSNLVLYPVHPNMSAQFRLALHPSGSKSDPLDTSVLLDLLEHHRPYLRPLRPDSPETRVLQMLTEQRRKLVDDKTRYSNRLTAWLKLYFPQALQWLDDPDCPMGCDFLQRWPSLQQLQRAKPNQLREFFVAHNCRSQARIQLRIQQIYAAQPATQDTAMLEGGVAMIAPLVGILKALATGIAELEQHIERVVSQHPEAPLFAALPGVGPALLPRLIAAFGTQRERYADASQLQSYSGVAPVTERSGKTQRVVFRHACPKFLRQTFIEFAGHSVVRCEWARAFYQLKRTQDKMGHQAALRALAFKWIRVLFRCWKNRTPYDDQIYRESLRRHHSPVSTQFTWHAVAGFHTPGREGA